MFIAGLVRSSGEGDEPRVIHDLRRAIVAGDEPPGTLIPIDEVARYFGVSHIPVREALKILTAEGLVEHQPRVGYSVAKVSFAEFSELYDVRKALEAAALRAAVQKATLVDDAVVRLAHEASLIATDADEYHVQSRRFHRALIATAGMRRLAHMYASAWNMTEAARPMAHVAEHERKLMCSQHGRILDAFVARDTERLLAESAAHFEHVKSAVNAFADDSDIFLQT